MKKRLWIISEFYYPIATSTGYYITEIAEYLANKDMEVHVICTNARYNETQHYNTKKEEFHNNVYIHRVLTGTIDKNNFIKRTIRLLFSSLSLFCKILTKVKRHDTILVVTNPAFILLAIPFVKLVKRVKYYLLVHDIFPENLLSTGKIKKESLLYGICKKTFDWAYSEADTCISIGRDMSDVIRSKTKNKTKIEMIPNWADIVDVFPIHKKDSSYCGKYGLTDKFIFQFAGNLGHVQGLDNIMQAIRLVDNPSMHFLFIGGGAKEQEIQDFADSAPLKNVTHIGFQERHMQNEFLNACDVGIVTLSDGMYGLGVPSKSYNIMASGKPILIIADENSEISRCVKEYGIGWVVPPDNPILLKKVFDLAYNCPELAEMGKRSRSVAEKHFAKTVILEQYYQLLV